MLCEFRLRGEAFWIPYVKYSICTSLPPDCHYCQPCVSFWLYFGAGTGTSLVPFTAQNFRPTKGLVKIIKVLRIENVWGFKCCQRQRGLPQFLISSEVRRTGFKKNCKREKKRAEGRLFITFRMNRFSQEGIWKLLSGSFYFWHSGKTRQLNGERLAPCGTLTQWVLCSLSFWGLFPSCFLTYSYFTRQSMPWVCGSFIPDPPFFCEFSATWSCVSGQ